MTKTIVEVSRKRKDDFFNCSLSVGTSGVTATAHFTSAPSNLHRKREYFTEPLCCIQNIYIFCSWEIVIWTFVLKFYFLSRIARRVCLRCIYLWVSRVFINIFFKNTFHDVNNREYLIKISFSFNFPECDTCMRGCRRRRWHRCCRHDSHYIFYLCYANEANK